MLFANCIYHHIALEDGPTISSAIVLEILDLSDAELRALHSELPMGRIDYPLQAKRNRAALEAVKQEIIRRFLRA
jgi:hypothetical protein